MRTLSFWGAGLFISSNSLIDLIILTISLYDLVPVLKVISFSRVFFISSRVFIV